MRWEFATASKSLLNAGSPLVWSTISRRCKHTFSEVSRLIAATRACSTTSGESCSKCETVAIKLRETEWRDAASADWLDYPGIRNISKRHNKLCCFGGKSQVLAISSRIRSPKILTSGLWSATKTRLLQPCVKYLVCSKLNKPPTLHSQLGRIFSQPTIEI